MTFSSLLLTGGFSVQNIQAMDLWAQGLFVVVVGLIGVFIVLFLFFLTIIVMQKISESITAFKAKKSQSAEVQS